MTASTEGGPDGDAADARVPADDSSPGAEDEAVMAGLAAGLADAVEASLAEWVDHAVRSRHRASLSSAEEARVAVAGRAATADIGPKLRQLLALDIDDQWTNPLAVIRTAVPYPTSVLGSIGVEPVDRDETAIRLHPDDVYDLTPASFIDLGEAVHDAGLMWGAAKAHLHIQRRKRKEMA